MNFEYEIVGINNGILDLQDVKQKWFNLYSSRKFGKISFFRHCFTCHSAQGSSIDGNVTIFDWNFYIVRNSLNGCRLRLQEKETYVKLSFLNTVMTKNTHSTKDVLKVTSVERLKITNYKTKKQIEKYLKTVV